MLNTIPNKRKKAWIISGASFFLVLCCAGVVWLDWNKIKEEGSQSEVLRTQIDKADARIRKIPEIELRVLRERAVVRKNVEILPDDKDINTFVSRISEFASACGIEVSSLDEKSAKDHQRKKTAETFARIVYKLSVRGNVHQFLDFLNKFETYHRFVSINQFTIKGGRPEGNSKESSGPIRHDIDLEIETYVYNARGSGEPPVEILNADQKLSKILRAEEIESLLQLESYNFVARHERRDPFLDPRVGEEAGGGDVSAENVEEQEALIKELETEWRRIESALAEEKKIEDVVTRLEFTRRLNTALAEFEARLHRVTREKSISNSELATAFKKGVMDPFDRLLKDRPRAAPAFALQEVESQYEKLKLAFEQNRLQDVLTSSQTLLSQRTEGIDESMQNVYKQVEVLRDRAQARLEFGQKQLAFSGVVFVRNNPKAAVVIINDRAYSPGDVMEDGVVIRSVDPAQVTFLYKKEEITRFLE